MEAQKNYYEILGVPEDASSEEIRVVYRELARIYHPDSNFYSEIIQDKAQVPEEDMFKLITTAYNTLVDIARRAEYDKQINPLLGMSLKTWDPGAKPSNQAVQKEGVSSGSNNARPRRQSGVFGRVDFEEPGQASSIDTALSGNIPAVSEILHGRSLGLILFFSCLAAVTATALVMVIR